MRSLYFISLIWITGIFPAKAQVTITGQDMPVPGDTVRFSHTMVLEGIDYERTGEGITWDFSGLTVMSQAVDTFVSPGSTPLAYQLVFNNPFLYPDHKATTAKNNTSLDIIPNITLSSTYLFYKNEGSSFSEIGAGATINGIPLTLPYDQFDVMYQFPLTYGHEFLSNANAGLDVPGMGYFYFTRSRDVTVEGWGTLITPYGSFETVKLRAEIEEFDSLFIDSLNMGFPVTRLITEYQWLANGYPGPVLTVTQEGFAVNAGYIDIYRTSFLDINDIAITARDVKVFPNPATDHFSVSYELKEPARTSLELFSASGHKIFSRRNGLQSRGFHTLQMNCRELGLAPGLYLLRLSAGNREVTRRVMIN